MVKLCTGIILATKAGAPKDGFTTRASIFIAGQSLRCRVHTFPVNVAKAYIEIKHFLCPSINDSKTFFTVLLESSRLPAKPNFPKCS